VKRTRLAAIVAAALAISALSSAQAQAKGPIVDKILFNAKSQEDLGLMDVASGASDVWNYGTDGSVFKRLPTDVQSKLETYEVSGASYLGLLINPYPNAAPYLSDPAKDASGKAQFNPLAIREVRYALNWLINRQKIVDEVFSGSGTPVFTPVVPGQPNASRFDLVAQKQGMTASGDEAKALADIDSAMKEAAALPALAGRLSKQGQWWTFDGSPVTIRFVIRADDPNARVPVGRYIADQIEKAGIKVERLEWERSKCSATVNRTDPASNQWNIYTEGLGSNQTIAYWEMTISYDYAPWATVMPGGQNPARWNYQNADLDSLTQAVVNGNVKDSADYWDHLLKATDLGMKESVRVFIAAKTSYLAANKSRFASRMAWGLGDGIDKWSMYTADVKSEASGADKGKKVLRLTGFSSRGALFMYPWDPVGANGFGDTYSGAIIGQVSDRELEANPATGVPMAVRATWSGMKSSPAAMKVPSDAVIWNSADKKWESGVGYTQGSADYGYAKGAQTARSEATFAFRYGAWHHGRPVTQNDYRYAIAFPYDIAFNAGAGDKSYDASYASGVNPRLVSAKGYRFNKDGTITVWSDQTFPSDKAQLAFLIAPSLEVAAVNSGAVLPWEVLEALKSLVSESSASGTVWSFNTDSGSTEVDLLNPKLVSDLKAKLAELAKAERVPASLKGFVSPEQAAKDYRLTLAWVEKHGHAYISNGGFVLDRYDPVGNTGILTAFRDPSYPFEKGYWTKALATNYSRVDAIKVADRKQGQALAVTVDVSSVSYPKNLATPAAKATVEVSLMVGDKATTVAAKSNKAGLFVASFPASLVDALSEGAYTIVASSNLGTGDTPASASTAWLKF